MKTMGILLAVLVLCMLFGCVDQPATPVSSYQCATPEMQKVEAETRFCTKEAGYRDTYCYESAISRNCQPKKVPGK